MPVWVCHGIVTPGTRARNAVAGILMPMTNRRTDAPAAAGPVLRLMLASLGLQVLAAPVAEGAENGDPLTSTRSVVEQWVQARQLTSQTRVDWERDRELMLQTKALHERELATIAERFSRLSTNTTQADRDLAAVRSELAASDAALGRLKGVVASLEARSRGLLVTLPTPLRRQLDPLVLRLPAEGDANPKATVGERFQTVVAMLNEIDKFNATVTVVGEVQKNPEGAEVQVETAYLGLSQAWFVDKSGEYAGRGTPGTSGWVWEALPGIASDVRRAIAAYRDTSAPAFVSLPFMLR